MYEDGEKDGGNGGEISGVFNAVSGFATELGVKFGFMRDEASGSATRRSADMEGVLQDQERKEKWKTAIVADGRLPLIFTHCFAYQSRVDDLVNALTSRFGHKVPIRVSKIQHPTNGCFQPITRPALFPLLRFAPRRSKS